MKRKNTNRIVLGIAATWQTGICVWLLLSGQHIPNMIVAGCFLLTAVTGLVTAAVPNCPAPWHQVSALTQGAGVLGAFIVASLARNRDIGFVPLIFIIWLGPSIIVAVIATLRRVQDPLYVLADIPPGVCTKCSYDLTGTLDAGRNTCPECGQVYERPVALLNPDRLVVGLIIVLVINIATCGTCGLILLNL